MGPHGVHDADGARRFVEQALKKAEFGRTGGGATREWNRPLASRRWRLYAVGIVRTPFWQPGCSTTVGYGTVRVP